MIIKFLPFLFFSAVSFAKTKELYTLTYGQHHSQTVLIKAIQIKSKISFVKSIIDDQSQIKTQRIKQDDFNKIKASFQQLQNEVSEFNKTQTSCTEKIIIQSFLQNKLYLKIYKK